MKRRGVTVLVGAILTVVLTWLVFGQANVPYVQLEPGPTFNTLGRTDNGQDVIVVKGAETYPSKGQLRFVTVGVLPGVSLLEALRGWWNPNEAVVPRELIYPPGKTNQQVEQQNAEEFKQSQSSAETAALTDLGYPVKVQVQSVQAGSAADGVLKPGDTIDSVDNTKITSAQQLVDLVKSKAVGSTLNLEITRDGKTQLVSLTTGRGPDGKSLVGVVPKEIQPHPFQLSVPVENVGGPSAGLMLALGIVDKLEPTDITGGRVIAGTGTIDDSGSVGPIGGVAQKEVAAKRDGATIFLTPKDNCADAVANAVPGLELVEVTSLHQALDALTTLRNGGTPPLCTTTP